MDSSARLHGRSVAHRRYRSLLLPAASVVGGGLAVAAVLVADPTTAAGIPLLPPCPINALFGLDCPGCGMARMLFSLLHADVGAALHYNALAMVFIPFFAWTWVAWVMGRWQGRSIPTWEQWRFSPLVAVTALGVWSVVRNLPFVPFTALHV